MLFIMLCFYSQSTKFSDSIESLKIVGKSDQYYLTNWKITFEYRRQQMSKYETFDELIFEWPIIGKRMGPYLVCYKVVISVAEKAKRVFATLFAKRQPMGPIEKVNAIAT